MARIRRLPRRNDDSGSVLVVAVAIAFVVVLLGSAALSQTVNGLTQSAIANKQVNSVDAAEAGLNIVESNMQSAAAAGQGTFTCPTAGTFAPGSTKASYSVSYVSYTTTGGAPTSPVYTACTGSTVTLSGGYTYLIKSQGSTTSSAFGSRTETAQVSVPSAVTYSQSGQYKEAIFAGVDIVGGGSFGLTGGDTYSGGTGLCGSNWAYGGNYFSDGVPVATGILGTLTAPTTFAGACNVSGNLYMNNSLGINITSGSGVAGSVYSSGPVTMNGGADVGGSLYSTAGLVSLNAGTVVGGSVYSGDPLLGVTTSGGPVVDGTIYSAGPVNLVNGTYGTSSTVNAIYGSSVTASSSTVNGNIYSSGAVTLTSGTYNGNIYADGSVTIQGGATVNGTIFTDGGVSDLNGTIGTVEDNGGLLVYLAKANGPAYWTNLAIPPTSLPFFGPTSFINGLPSGFPLPYTSAVTSGSTGTVGTVVQAQLVSAASTVNGTTGTTTSVTFPSLAYDQNAWLDNTKFCGAASCTTSTMNLWTVDVSTQAACSTLWSDVQAIEVSGAKPTVIQTNCQFLEGVGASGYGPVSLYNNLAIFDTAGFNLTSSFAGFKSGDGNAHQLYMIVPSSSTLPNLGLPNIYVLSLLNTIQNNSLFPTEYPNGETSCSLADGPDIVVDTPLTDAGDNIEDFLYTPANICSNGGNATLYGKIYAGQSFWPNSNWSQKYYDIDPWTSSVGNSGQQSTSAGTPVVQYISQSG